MVKYTDTNKKQYDRNKKQEFKNKKMKKLTNEDVLETLNMKISRDAEWFKRTVEKINEVKEDLDKKSFTEEKKKEKIDFIRKLKNKLKDYRDAIQYADKYKMVRFFERKKLEKSLKRSNKELEGVNKEDKEKVDEATQKRDKIIADINYVKVKIVFIKIN